MTVTRVDILDGAYAETPEGWALLGTRCTSCGQVFFPAKKICYECFGIMLEPLSLSRRGTLYSYTIGRMPSTRFEPPFAVGYVDLPEGVRIFSPIKMVEGKPLKIGLEVELVVERLRMEEEKEIIGYKFTPVIVNGENAVVVTD